MSTLARFAGHLLMPFRLITDGCRPRLPRAGALAERAAFGWQLGIDVRPSTASGCTNPGLSGQGEAGLLDPSLLVGRSGCARRGRRPRRARSLTMA